MVKLYEGCWGKRRDGKIVGPIQVHNGKSEWSFKCSDILYTKEGTVFLFSESKYDIIEIYPSDPRVKTQEPSPFNLTTREQWRWWFAGQAMQGIISSNTNDWVDNHGKKVSFNTTSITELSVKYAEKLIEQLEKGKENE